MLCDYALKTKYFRIATQIFRLEYLVPM